MEHKETSPLRWPEGFGRTLIGERKSQRAWKKQMPVYVKQAMHELALLGAGLAEISYNSDPELAKRDPGVAVWFSVTRTKDTSWQTGLQIDNPNPTRQEIDKAFKRLSFKHHPDQVAGGSGGDVKAYMKLEEHWRNAKAWIQGESIYTLENCMPMDLYEEPRQNMAGIKLYFAHLRALQRLGSPFIVERMVNQSFRAALTANASSEEKNVNAVA